MSIRKNSMARGQAGQSIVETVLMMPVLLLFLLNAVNFGYFFFTITNLAAAPRTGVEYSIIGRRHAVGHRTADHRALY